MICRKCKRSGLVSGDFYYHRTNVSGLGYSCKDCVRSYIRGNKRGVFRVKRSGCLMCVVEGRGSYCKACVKIRSRVYYIKRCGKDLDSRLKSLHNLMETLEGLFGKVGSERHIRKRYMKCAEIAEGLIGI